ncbi:MAG: 3-keto-5-aminohexanoate cleavage protein [Methylocystaceae bacterium]|nr:3-keto-5-aminohexanoate cleavage protein [Methylocystaceae bacterium]
MTALLPMMFTVAPNGARLTQKDHPALPITPQELARCAAQCAEAGAGMIHLHVRKPDGTHVLDGEGYRDAIAAIRREVLNRIVIQITTEAVGIYKPLEQMAVVRDVKPEAVSLGLRELLPVDVDEKAFADFWQWMRKEHVWPQIILYDSEDVVRLRDLQKRGVLGGDRLSVLFVLGRYGKQQADPAELLTFLSAVEDLSSWDWSVCAFGARENGCIAASACLGGHGRLGYENNRLLADGTVSRDNAELISQAVKTAELVGRRAMNVREIRQKFMGE